MDCDGTFRKKKTTDIEITNVGHVLLRSLPKCKKINKNCD